MQAAERDLKRAELAFKERDYPATAFWAQQAVEKALKALLLLKKGTFPKIHNIKRLKEELGEDLGLSEEACRAVVGRAAEVVGEALERDQEES